MAMVSPSSPPHLVLIPFKDKGHIAPMMILAEKLVLQKILITIVCVQPEAHSIITGTGINPGINLLLVKSTHEQEEKDIDDNALESQLHSLKLSHPPPAAVLVDIILNSTKDAIDRCHLPRYVLYTASCTNLAVMFGIKPRIDLPRFDRESTRHGPGHHRHRGQNWAPDLFDSQAVLVNSAYELEGGELDRIREMTKKRVYPVGPLLDDEKTNEEETDPSPCLRWMDKQMPGSVIFIAYGSRTYLREEQIREIATALESSKQPFLWLLPVPPEFETPDEYMKLVLPEGFKDREQAGMIMSDWAPQKLILKHKSLAAFVTHCGWNSVLECLLLAAKPMLCWPVKADQPVNCRLIVDDLKVGLEVKMDEQGLVRSEQIVEKFQRLAGEEGGQMKSKLKELQAQLNAATQRSSMENVRAFAKEIWSLQAEK